MSENEQNKEEIASALEKTLKKYRMFLFSAVGVLVVVVLLFTNYDMGSKLTGYMGQESNSVPPTLGAGGSLDAPKSENPAPPANEAIKSEVAKTVVEAMKKNETAKTEVTKTVDSATKPATKTATTSATATSTTAVPLTLTKALLSSKEFNPLVDNAKFTIKTSADAKVDIKIYDKDGNIVASPANNKDVSGDKEYDIFWEGENEAKTTLPSGAYTYKILAKDALTKETKDTKTGDVGLKYGSEIIVTKPKDFEDINGKTSGSNSAVPSQPTQSVTTQVIEATAVQSTQNGKATLALQNATDGKTAGTGPETIIYLIFPILGYTVSRKFK
ncbi:MAG: FlgD immunoglobulin-like domain containing protein [Candidatus Gracilibacteria bacterium]|jgi:flagellar hook assembly protein FlgD